MSTADPELGITILHPHRLTHDLGQFWIYRKQLEYFACYRDPEVGDIIAVRSDASSDEHPLFFELAAEVSDGAGFWLLPINPDLEEVPLTYAVAS